ncbi:MAG: DUF2304 domain-containing protein [Acidobacteriota bacterium]
MNLFQWITVPVFALLACLSAFATVRRRIGRGIGVLWTVLSIAGATAIGAPDTTRVIARALGIGRGADLVFYCAIVGAALGFFAIFVRLRALDEQLTELVRRNALESPIHPGQRAGLEDHVVANDRRGRRE